jgi:hypothetical protein
LDWWRSSLPDYGGLAYWASIGPVYWTGIRPVYWAGIGPVYWAGIGPVYWAGIGLVYRIGSNPFYKTVSGPVCRTVAVQSTGPVVVQYNGRVRYCLDGHPEDCLRTAEEYATLGRGVGRGDGKPRKGRSTVVIVSLSADDYRRHLGIMIVLHTCKVCWNTGTVVLDVL